MRLNPAGEMIQQAWHTMPDRFPTVHLDAFAVMPNHIHGIIILIDPTFIEPDRTNVGVPLVGAPTDDSITDRAGTRDAPTSPSMATLGDVVGAFKSITTHQYIQDVKHQGWIPFAKRLWQRNYWEHIIRGGKELDRIRQYIDEKPARWYWDRLYVG